jgi:TM2 domain-containing membrane protein YozV
MMGAAHRFLIGSTLMAIVTILLVSLNIGLLFGVVVAERQAGQD